MANESTFPATLDVFANPTRHHNQSDATLLHSSQHAKVNNCIIAIETSLGLTGTAAAGDVKIQGGKLYAKYEDGLWYRILFPTVDGVRTIAISDTPE